MEFHPDAAPHETRPAVDQEYTDVAMNPMGSTSGSCRNKSPIDCTHVFRFRDWQDGVERAAHGTGHVFGTDDWAIVFLQPADLSLEVFRPRVIMKGDNVGFA